MNELKSAIGQIAAFMICAQAIAHFRPKEVYSKYLRILLSAMILVQLLQPFCGLFLGISGEELYAGVAEFQQELERSMAVAAAQSSLAENRLESMSLGEVQQRLAEQEKRQEQEASPEDIEGEGIEKIDVKIDIEEVQIESGKEALEIPGKEGTVHGGDDHGTRK